MISSEDEAQSETSWTLIATSKSLIGLFQGLVRETLAIGILFSIRN